jgi:hypothetical protein
MEKYLGLTSGFIYQRMIEEVHNTAHILSKYRWREGTKPQDKQLEATQNCTERLENMYENYLKDHITVMRILTSKGIRCNQTLECLTMINTLRNKGIIAVLKKYHPNLGKNVEPDMSKKYGSKNVPMHIDDRFGVYGKDWIWAQASLYTGKLLTTYFNIDGITYLDDATVTRLGHDKLEQAANQNSFDAAFTKLYHRHTSQAVKAKATMATYGGDVRGEVKAEAKPAPSLYDVAMASMGLKTVSTAPTGRRTTLKTGTFGVNPTGTAVPPPTYDMPQPVAAPEPKMDMETPKNNNSWLDQYHYATSWNDNAARHYDMPYGNDIIVGSPGLQSEPVLLSTPNQLQ